jgi:hypothetical protein
VQTYHELWFCFEDDMLLKPARILIDQTANPDAPYRYTERIAADYRRNGPATLPHRLREAGGNIVDGVFEAALGDQFDRRRQYLINHGLPSSKEWADLLSQAMEDPFFEEDEAAQEQTSEDQEAPAEEQPATDQ